MPASRVSRLAEEEAHASAGTEQLPSKVSEAPRGVTSVGWVKNCRTTEFGEYMVNLWLIYGYVIYGYG